MESLIGLNFILEYFYEIVVGLLTSVGVGAQGFWAFKIFNHETRLSHLEGEHRILHGGKNSDHTLN